MSRWIKTLGLLFGGLGLAGAAPAQDGAFSELYGYGVHRYFAGDLQEAERVLSLVVESGTNDPRPLFFRGLTKHQLGQLDLAKVDFETGARLEAAGKKAVNVSAALQRIQGPIRNEIELLRLNARVAQQNDDASRRRTRNPTQPAPGLIAPADPNAGALPPSVTPENAAAVPATPAVPVEPVAPAQPAAPATPAITPATPPADTTNPFGDDPVQPAAPATPAAPAAPAAEPNPFGDAPAATEPAPAAPAADDPFAAPPTTPPAGEPAPAAPSDNPFGNN
ncbi:MAG: hypothetical protein U0892_15055 [Pirellulales bacterium]